MLEKDIEAKLKKGIDRLGGECYKFTSPGHAGVPDRLILLPGGTMAFAELKAPGKKERKLQRHVQDQIRAMGFAVFSSVDSEQKVDEITAWAAMKIRATQGSGKVAGTEVENGTLSPA